LIEPFLSAAVPDGRRQRAQPHRTSVFLRLVEIDEAAFGAARACCTCRAQACRGKLLALASSSAARFSPFATSRQRPSGDHDDAVVIGNDASPHDIDAAQTTGR